MLITLHQDLTLSQRALKVLLKVYPEESGGHWRKLALARDIIAVFSGLVEDYGPEEKPHCTSQSWFTRERIVWADLSASGGSVEFDRIFLVAVVIIEIFVHCSKAFGRRYR